MFPPVPGGWWCKTREWQPDHTATDCLQTTFWCLECNRLPICLCLSQHCSINTPWPCWSSFLIQTVFSLAWKAGLMDTCVTSVVTTAVLPAYCCVSRSWIMNFCVIVFWAGPLSSLAPSSRGQLFSQPSGICLALPGHSPHFCAALDPREPSFLNGGSGRKKSDPLFCGMFRAAAAMCGFHGKGWRNMAQRGCINDLPLCLWSKWNRSRRA